MDTQSFPIHADPEDASVLSLEHRHRSSTISSAPDMGHILTCRHKFIRGWKLDDRVRPYIMQSGFYNFHRVGYIKLD